MSYDPKHLELFYNRLDGPWIDNDTNKTSQGTVYMSYRCLNGYRLTVSQAQQGERRWFVHVNGNIYGSCKTRDAAKRKAERYARSLA